MRFLKRKYAKQRLIGFLAVWIGIAYCLVTCLGVESIKDFTPAMIFIPAGLFLMCTKGVYIC